MFDCMISYSQNTGGMRSSNSNERYASSPNIIEFQLGKRKKQFLDNEADESISSNGDKAIIGGSLTPNRRKKAKLLKMSPGPPLKPNRNHHIYNTNTLISDSKDEIQLKSADNEKCVNKEKINAGGSLRMLMDAIRLIEDRPRTVGIDTQEKDLISVLPEDIRQGKSSEGRPSLQNDQFCANGGMETAKALVLDTQPSDGQGISKAVDMDEEEIPRTRSKRGWLPTLPSKYSDSVLQPWKKVPRKVPKY